MKTILITGASGFVGKSLFKSLSLAEKYNIVTLNRSDINILSKQDVKIFLDKIRPDIIFHCANDGGSRATGYDIASIDITMNNLKMFFNLAENKHDKTKLITFGSGAAYNKARDLIKISEDKLGDILPDDAYGFSKLVMHKFINDRPHIISPIIFGLFGEFEDYRFKFITNAIIKNLFKLPIVINQNVFFDYLYMGDFLNIMDLLIDNEYDIKSFNITPDDSIDLLTVVNIINDISDFKSEIIIKNKGLNFQYTANNSLMKSMIGDFKFTRYEQSIVWLYRYFQNILTSISYEEIATDEYIKNCKTKA